MSTGVIRNSDATATQSSIGGTASPTGGSNYYGFNSKTSSSVFFVALAVGIVVIIILTFFGGRYFLRNRNRSSSTREVALNANQGRRSGRTTRAARRRRKSTKRLLTQDEVTELFPSILYKEIQRDVGMELASIHPDDEDDEDIDDIPEKDLADEKLKKELTVINEVNTVDDSASITRKNTRDHDDGKTIAEQPDSNSKIGQSSLTLNGAASISQQTQRNDDDNDDISSFMRGFEDVPLTTIDLSELSAAHLENNDDPDDGMTGKPVIPTNEFTSRESTETKVEQNNEETIEGEHQHIWEIDTCAICIDVMDPEDEIRVLSCGHIFHTECIDPWLTKRNAFCPLCKEDLYILAHPDEKVEEQPVIPEENSTATNNDPDAAIEAQAQAQAQSVGLTPPSDNNINDSNINSEIINENTELNGFRNTISLGQRPGSLRLFSRNTTSPPIRPHSASPAIGRSNTESFIRTPSIMNIKIFSLGRSHTYTPSPLQNTTPDIENQLSNLNSTPTTIPRSRTDTSITRHLSLFDTISPRRTQSNNIRYRQSVRSVSARSMRSFHAGQRGGNGRINSLRSRTESGMSSPANVGVFYPVYRGPSMYRNSNINNNNNESSSSLLRNSQS